MTMSRFLSKDEILLVHENQIALYGGTTGLRDVGLLESALAMPQATFGDVWLHDDLYDKAAAYLFYLVSNHPFVDGNKRVGTVAALMFLDLNGVWFPADADFDAALESLVFSVARGEMNKVAVAAFFRKHGVPF